MYILDCNLRVESNKKVFTTVHLFLPSFFSFFPSFILDFKNLTQGYKWKASWVLASMKPL